MKTLLAAFLVALLLVTSGVAVMAQEATEVPEPEASYVPGELIELEFDGKYVINIPNDWLTWLQSDYPIPDLASLALIDMVHQVDPEISFETTPPVTNLSASALAPVKVDGEMVSLNVMIYKLSERAAASGMSREQITPIMMLAAVEPYKNTRYAPIAVETVNGRNVAVGYIPIQVPSVSPDGRMVPKTVRLDLGFTYLFPDQDAAVLVRIILPPSYINDHLDQIITTALSMRLIGEELDVASIQTVLGEDSPEAESTPEQ